MITAIDKATALILIDLQKGILQRPLAHPINDVLEKAALLVEAFRKANLPIVVVNVIPGGAWLKNRKDSNNATQNTATPSPAADFSTIVDAIKTQSNDIFITKENWSAFYNTKLQEELQKRNITGIVLAGVSTSAGVEGTARAASERGYNICFATDAMTDSNSAAHENSMRHIFPRLGELGTASEIIIKKLEE